MTEAHSFRFRLITVDRVYRFATDTSDDLAWWTIILMRSILENKVGQAQSVDALLHFLQWMNCMFICCVEMIKTYAWTQQDVCFGVGWNNRCYILLRCTGDLMMVLLVKALTGCSCQILLSWIELCATICSRQHGRLLCWMMSPVTKLL